MKYSPKRRFENSHLGRSSRRQEAHISWCLDAGTRNSQSLLTSAATFPTGSEKSALSNAGEPSAVICPKPVTDEALCKGADPLTPPMFPLASLKQHPGPL